MKKKSKLTVVLLTRNRNNLATQALKSLVEQDFSDFQLVISDNSDDSSFEAIVMQTCTHFAQFSYVKRAPPLSSEDHFKQVLREIESDYFLLFHDDDVARPNFISSLLTFITNNPNKVAVACNGVTINEGVVGKKGMFFSNDELVEILTSEELLLKYFSLDGHGCAPFPSYMYKSEAIPLFLSLKHILGKHSDLQWLISLFTLGGIAWLPQKLIEYRVHSFSDSAQESLKDRLSILGFLKNNYPAISDRYRFIFYLLITARYHRISPIKNFYISKSAVKYFICKQFIKEFMSGSITSWLSYKIKHFIYT